MAGSRIPGSICGNCSPPIDDGTLARWLTPVPGPMCQAPPARQSYRYSRAGGFSASMLTMSPEAVALLKGIEKLRLKPYDDQTSKDITAWVKGATIGYGHLISSDEWGSYENGITASQAEALFLADVAPFERVVGDTIRVGIQQYEFDALVILAFNIGKNAFRGSAVAMLVNNPTAKTKHLSLESAWKAWNLSNNTVMQGLVNRRAAEWRIYSSGIYARW